MLNTVLCIVRRTQHICETRVRVKVSDMARIRLRVRDN